MGRHGDTGWGRKPRILFTTPEEKAVLEARNGLLLFDFTQPLFRSSNGILNLSPGILQECHRITVAGIYGCAGEFRREPVAIDRSRHVPPKFLDVPHLVEEMCAYANENLAPMARPFILPPTCFGG